MKSKKLVLRIIASCIIIILFILYFFRFLNIPIFVISIAVVLVLFWILLKAVEK